MSQAIATPTTPAGAATRRGFPAGAAVLAAPPAASAMPTAHPDAELIRLCAEHAANLKAFNASSLNAEDDLHWAACARTHSAISAAKPVTIEGMQAKARAAKAEAATPDGGEAPACSTAEKWAWDLVNDLLGSAVA